MSWYVLRLVIREWRSLLTSNEKIASTGIGEAMTRCGVREAHEVRQFITATLQTICYRLLPTTPHHHATGIWNHTSVQNSLEVNVGGVQKAVRCRRTEMVSSELLTKISGKYYVFDWLYTYTAAPQLARDEA